MAFGKVEKRVDIITKFRSNVKQFANIMKMPLNSFKKIHDNTGRLNKVMAKNQTAMGRFGFGLRRVTHGMRGFRMELLGVMFFGMGVQKFFTGLLQPALKMAGVLELMSTTLAILFLPVALLLLDILLPIFTWFMNLSDATKLLIGKMVVWGAILGGALFLIGMFGLGIGSLILAFGGLLGIIEKLFPEPLGDFAASFIGINAAVLGIGVGASLWESLKGIIGGVWDKLMQIPVFKGLLEKLGISIEDIKNPWDAIKKKVIDTFDTFSEKLGIKDKVDEFKDKVKDINFKEFADSMMELSETLITFLPRFSELVELALKLATVSGKVLDFIFGSEPGPTPVSRFGESGVPFTAAFGGGGTPSPTDLFNQTPIVNVFINGVPTTAEEAQRLGVSVEPG